MTTSAAGRLREVTIVISTQYSVDLTWNIVPVFGFPKPRKMFISLEVFKRLEHMVYEQSSKQHKWNREWKMHGVS